MVDKETFRYSQPKISTKGTKSVDTQRKERHLWCSGCWDQTEKAALSRQVGEGVTKVRSHIFEDYAWLPIRENPKITVSLKEIDFIYLSLKSP